MPEQTMLPPATTVTGPGVYLIPPEEYFARPELSSTAIRHLLPPSCPALFKQWREDGDEPKKAWDIGSAAHKLVLGVGPELEIVEGDGKLGPEVWNTDKVRAKVTSVRERGAVPLKPSEHATVHAMAAALRAHPIASALFTPRGKPDLGYDGGAGEAEVTVIWQDERTGVRCKALVDYVPYFSVVDGKGQPAKTPAMPSSRRLIPDYKTTGIEYGASPEKINKAMADRGYFIQMAWYLMGLRAVGWAREDTEALLVVQETRKPYLVTVAQPDPTAMRMGAIRCRQALDLFAECVRDNHWPGYSDDVVLAELPPWETRELNGAVW
jgi:hypothetical protein